MKKGFFSSTNFISKKKTSTIAHCGSCGLHRNCISPKMPPTGKGKKKILIVAEAPGEQEDKHNTQLIGKAGQLFRKHLRSLDIDLDRDCWKTNAVICRRKGSKPPDDNMIEACYPNLAKTIKEKNPKAIILLGGTAMKSLLSSVYKTNIGKLRRWADYCIPCHDPNAWIIPTYHPSYLLKRNDEVLTKVFKNHLREAIKRSKARPWKTVPSFKDEIEIIMNPAKAAKEIDHMIKKGGAIAFDYECNCLKPDEMNGPKIISCSVCWKGKKTIAFPFEYDAITAMWRLLKSPLPKIACNLKFEDRWTRYWLNTLVKNWHWDTMLAAHVLNNNPGVTSLKFQAFVLLGMGSYDEHISPYLKSTKEKKFNRIHEIDMKDLLLYNGLDSLLTYKVAMKQMKLFENRKGLK